MLRQAVLWLFDLSLAVLASGQVYSAKSIVRRSANSWFSNLERRERAAHRAKSPRQIQGADPGHDPPDTGDQPTAADRRPHAIPHRMARLLRLLPDPACAHQPGSVDSPKTTLVSLAAVAERAQPLPTNCAVVAYRSSMQRSPPVRRQGSGVCQDTPRSNKPCATTISTRSVSPDCMSLLKLNPIEPPWYVTRMPGGVGGVAPRGVPLSRSTGNFLQPKYPDKRRNRERTGKRRRIVNASVASSRSRQRQAGPRLPSACSRPDGSPPIPHPRIHDTLRFWYQYGGSPPGTA